MSQYLSKYFSGIGAKRLSEIEINPATSNQHEFNGIAEFLKIFGTEKISFKGKFIYLEDDPEKTLLEDGILTWYDARANHPSRTEYRLYYSTNAVIEGANVGDLVFIGRRSKDELVIIIASEGTTTEQQIKWLFGFEEIGNKFIVKDIAIEDKSLDYFEKKIVALLDIDPIETAPDFLGTLLAKFGNTFPATALFSEFARSTVVDLSPIEEPDKTLVRWLEREEILFKTLEKHIVSKRLEKGFGNKGIDVDEFINYSLSVHNRRKSRAGYSFENHLEAIFLENKLSYSRGQKTERNNKPDFIFPGIAHYRDSSFNSDLLTMLGVKTTAKDRWRQVLSEAERIENKHLITLEPAISINQTDEMRALNLQLIVPAEIIPTYTEKQKSEIISLSDFIGIVRDRQTKCKDGRCS